MLHFNPVEYNNWLIRLDIIDSTNNYAMQLLQDGMAQSGTVVSAKFQSAGKGQRGKLWRSSPGQNVAMSLILADMQHMDMFRLAFLVPVSVRQVLQSFMPECQVLIKWPNDIYVNDRKICGILIENVFRGSSLRSAVIGIGINVNQSDFGLPDKVPTSLLLETGRAHVPEDIIAAVRAAVLKGLERSSGSLWQEYNRFLWKRDTCVRLGMATSGELLQGTVQGVNADFELVVRRDDGELCRFSFGSVQWL